MVTGRASPVSRGNAEKISYFSLTAGGALMALKLRDRFGGTAHLPRCHSLGCERCSPFDSISESLPDRFLAGDAIVAVMAAGIVFRLLSPHLSTKQADPAVIVLDEEGRNVIPLLGGHAAGANEIAREIAEFLGGNAAITTASDVRGLTAPDEVARRLGCRITDQKALRSVTSLLVDGKNVCIESPRDPGIKGYGWIEPGSNSAEYDGRLLISHMAEEPKPSGSGKEEVTTARLAPPVIFAGLGCKRGTETTQIIDAIKKACASAGIDPRALGGMATVDAKGDEPGMAEASNRLGVELTFYSPKELSALGRPGNTFVEKAVGTPAVSEPAALLAAGEGAALVMPKTVFGFVTVALAKKELRESPRMPDSGVGRKSVAAPEKNPGKGLVLVVGTGAGTAELLTEQAAAAIDQADIVMGYRTYIEQIRGLFPEKDLRSGSMGREVDRCREALKLAAEGKTVAMISSGDPGIYGMAGPLLEMANGTPVHVLPGVTAAQIAASRLGAPLMNDFITLSLSDLLTPRQEVLRRAASAAASDMVICIYNPTSRKRQPLYEEACALLLRHRLPATAVGWVRDAGGPDEETRIITLGQLAAQDTDMRTVIIVGNSRTEVIGGRMVTRRGYRSEE